MNPYLHLSENLCIFEYIDFDRLHKSILSGKEE